MISAGFAALCANGSRQKRAAGAAPIAVSRNFISAAATHFGIRLKPAARAPAAVICGAGLPVCDAKAGLCTQIGTQAKRTNHNENPRNRAARSSSDFG